MKSTTEIAKEIRRELKDGCKWSVTSEYFAGGSSMCVALMEAPEPVFNSENNRGYAQVNQYHIDSAEYLTDYGKSQMQKANSIINKYDGFYSHINIGRWDRPFRVIN